MTEIKNGSLNLRTFLIISAIFVGILTTVFGVVGNSISEVGSGLSGVEVTNSDQGERISTNEANIFNIADRLNRIEGKLDQILYKIK